MTFPSAPRLLIRAFASRPPTARTRHHVLDPDIVLIPRMLSLRIPRLSLISRTMASAFSVLGNAASAPSSAGYHAQTNGASHNATGPSRSEFTVTALNRWSVANKKLPPVDKIRALHVYDFDNTRTRLPVLAAVSFSCQLTICT